LRTSPLARFLALVLVIGLTGCTDMKDQPRYESLEETTFFAAGRSAPPLVEGTVSRGTLRDDDAMYRGITAEGDFVTALPMSLTPDLLARGRERYDIFCSPCHGQSGYGDGMIVQRGYKAPASFHEDRLKAMPHGYYFDVITNGFGVMSSYASQVKTEDRWAIIAYLRALQWSQDTPLDAVPADVRDRLEQGEIVDTRPQPKEAGHGHEDGH